MTSWALTENGELHEDGGIFIAVRVAVLPLEENCVKHSFLSGVLFIRQTSCCICNGGYDLPLPKNHNYDVSILPKGNRSLIFHHVSWLIVTNKHTSTTYLPFENFSPLFYTIWNESSRPQIAGRCVDDKIQASRPFDDKQGSVDANNCSARLLQNFGT